MIKPSLSVKKHAELIPPLKVQGTVIVSGFKRVFFFYLSIQNGNSSTLKKEK